VLVRFILLLIFVVRTSASDCLEDRLRNDLQCVERDVKPYSLTHSLSDLRANRTRAGIENIESVTNSLQWRKQDQNV